MATGKHVAYYRVSTAKQGRSGLGLEAQQAAVRTFLNGGSWELIGEVVEVESGKRDDNRPQLLEALRLCRTTGATLIVAKLDRLSRDAAFLMSLQNSGAQFVAADMPGANTFTVGVMALVAQQEREAISSRTKAALAAAKARGVRLGGNRGHELPSHRAAAASAAARTAKARASAADILVSIEHARANGATSLREIAAALNAAGTTTPRGGKWQASQVKRVVDRDQV
ncbi:recombinase family protein [Sphingomonas aliaeris]|uniref:Recombinase family protein n=1 Tax=Sphingomonas aliaeris TaxID=2759526 RepID=A0A974S2W6_9SPHN|nr:recombinase family protein [Sphingomonas aliaeris]QQV75866.1 recombinase family protein [Sphingomonas aliaeris]